ncbi:MAG: UDP-N-acetylglucosamine 2-epimerase [Sulfuricaulis sp.]|nr:UDP-N-acetylglucosamine 2-epimerase [Sulfuricaulis sp.]
MKVTIVTGSRADFGLLAWPIKTMQEDAFFEGQIHKIWGATFDQAFRSCTDLFTAERPDLMLCLGDRYEILAAATAAHLLRVPIAHIGGGDVTEGSYDDAMRDCISRMASVHFLCSTSAMARLSHMGLRNVHLVGNPGIDYIRHADWKKERPIAEPYVVVAYYPETIDGNFDLPSVDMAIAGRKAVWIKPNPDRGSEFSPAMETYPHAEFLNLLAHCEEFIGNSSAMLYEAPELGIKTKMIGKRQKGRTIPFGDGNASARMVNILKHCAL